MKIVVRSTEKIVVNKIKDWLLTNVVPLIPDGVMIKVVVGNRKIFSNVDREIFSTPAKDVIEIYSALSTQELKLATNLHTSREVLLLHFSKGRVRDRSEALAIRHLEENVDKKYNREYYPYVPLL